TSRWAMSFLRGPLTRSELLRLREAEALPTQIPAPAAGGDAGTSAGVPPDARPDGIEAGRRPPASHAPSAASPTLADLARDETPVAPTVSAEARVFYLDPAAPWARE